MIKRLARALEKEYEAREKALKIQRKALALCREAINELHIGKKSEKERRIRSHIKQIERILSKYPCQKEAALGIVYQEYAEYLILKSILEKKRVKIGLPAKYVLMGFGDAVGEVKRRVIVLLSEGRLEEAQKIYESLKQASADFLSIALPNSIIPTLKKKQDICRYALKDIAEAIFYAKSRK
ncbi:hypothetical protein DRN74_01210 [Candidatus Micrarchaeota archaeon]|nr:MAG: hypothetical protein DRN74_01210 [Candidatus Micrarchaeota archaeon]